MKSQSKLGVTIPREHTALLLSIIPIETIIFSAGQSKEFILEIQEIGGKQSVGDLNIAISYANSNFAITYDDAETQSITGIKVNNFYSTSTLVPLSPSFLSFTVTPNIAKYSKHRYLFVAENIGGPGFSGSFSLTVNPAISAGSKHYTSIVSVSLSTI